VRTERNPGAWPLMGSSTPAHGGASDAVLQPPAATGNGFQIRFVKLDPRPAARGGGTEPLGRQGELQDGAGGLQVELGFCMGSGPASRNFGPPADEASCVTQPMGFGNSGEDGCRIWIRTSPFSVLKAGATCSTISPS